MAEQHGDAGTRQTQIDSQLKGAVIELEAGSDIGLSHFS